MGSKGDGGSSSSRENMAVKSCLLSLEVRRRSEKFAACGLDGNSSRSLRRTLWIVNAEEEM